MYQLYELKKAKNWAIGMIVAAIIQFIVTIILLRTGWWAPFFFILGAIFLMSGIVLNVVCSSHRRSMKEFEEMVDRKIKQATGEGI
ncbi:MAG: hypothetical protein FWC93_01635 [Defluviitaleaceae bacterium]|nr:hypothetical protein [Defluviitaleaceae bacterium]